MRGLYLDQLTEDDLLGRLFGNLAEYSGGRRFVIIQAAARHSPSAGHGSSVGVLGGQQASARMTTAYAAKRCLTAGRMSSPSTTPASRPWRRRTGRDSSTTGRKPNSQCKGSDSPCNASTPDRRRDRGWPNACHHPPPDHQPHHHCQFFSPPLALRWDQLRDRPRRPRKY